MRASSSSSITPVTAGISSCLASVERHPDQFHQFGVGPGHALDAMRDRACIQGEETRIEAARPAGRGDGAADEMQRAEIGQDFRLGECAPWSRRNLHRLVHRHARAEVPVSSNVSRMAASANARALAALARCRCFIRFASAWGSSGFATGMSLSTGSTRPPGKTNFARHEFVPLVALAEQDFGQRPGPVDQDQRGRILRPHVGRREVALDLVHPLDEAVHPLEPVRLHVAHDRVSSISLRPLSVTCCRVSPSTNAGFFAGAGLLC